MNLQPAQYAWARRFQNSLRLKPRLHLMSAPRLRRSDWARLLMALGPVPPIRFSRAARLPKCCSSIRHQRYSVRDTAEAQIETIRSVPETVGAAAQRWCIRTTMANGYDGSIVAADAGDRDAARRAGGIAAPRARGHQDWQGISKG